MSIRRWATIWNQFWISIRISISLIRKLKFWEISSRFQISIWKRVNRKIWMSGKPLKMKIWIRFSSYRKPPRNYIQMRSICKNEALILCMILSNHILQLNSWSRNPGIIDFLSKGITQGPLLLPRTVKFHMMAS